MHDFIKSALKNIKRNKKNPILIIIFSLLLFLLFVDMCVFKNFFSFYESIYKKSVLVHTLSVYNADIGPDEAIEELKDIAHVYDVYESSYNLIGVQSNLNDNGLDGLVGLRYGIKNMVPKSIIGKNADELLPGELVCPNEFYPDGSYETVLDIDESKFLTKNQLLNREVVLSYWNRLRTPGEEDVLEKEIHTKTMKIVGLYDITKYRNDINECYIGMDDMKEIRDIIAPPQGKKDYAILRVIVDNRKNMNEVRKQIQDKGTYIVETISIFDYAFVGTLFTVVIIVAVVIVLSILFIIKNYISKKIKNEAKYMGILRACGYTKKQVIVKEIIENSLVLFVSFAISISLFSVLFVLLNEKALKYLQYVGFEVRLNAFVLVFTFVLVLFIVEYINYRLIDKKIENTVSNVLMEE